MNKFNNKGFTLIEISIVLIIFGLIIGGIMGPLQVQLAHMDRKETKQDIDLFKKSIVGFALRNGRLPCPDTSGNGQENQTGANCTNVRGAIPWVTLGVGNMDPWNRPYLYQVDGQFADNADGTGCPDADVAGVSFEICSAGNIQVRDSNGGNFVATNVPAIIVSRGNNWAAAGTADEQENSDNDTTFVDRKHQLEGYDDIVGWVNLNNLVGTMVSANKLP